MWLHILFVCIGKRYINADKKKTKRIIERASTWRCDDLKSRVSPSYRAHYANIHSKCWPIWYLDRAPHSVKAFSRFANYLTLLHVHACSLLSRRILFIYIYKQIYMQKILYTISIISMPIYSSIIISMYICHFIFFLT